MADIPDFDSMSPEEVMAWMESLAKRQGATEGFTTAADLDINEVDPSTIQLDEPGYVPFGEENRRPPQASKPAEPASPAKETPPPLPTFEDEGEQDTETSPTAEIRGMAWLETLAADQGGDFPEIDLSSLSAELDTDEAPQAEAAGTNPVAWLESLSGADEDSSTFDFDDDAFQFQSYEDAEDNYEEYEEDIELEKLEDDTFRDFEAEPDSEPIADFSDIDDPLAAGVDPMAWLESLARRQGAKDEELTIRSVGRGASIPQSEPLPVDDEPETASIDPAAWLESLAADKDDGSEFDLEAATMSDEDIQQALARGVEIPRDEMAAFLDRQLKRQLEGGEIPVGEYDPDAPAEKAELPDWLLESVQPPAELDEEEVPEGISDFSPALLDEIVEPPDIPDLPDWLREDMDVMPELDDIFAAGSAEMVEEPPAPQPSATLDIDTDDPWVVAFDEESESDPNIVPDWYQQNIHDPQRIAQVERQAGSEFSELQEADMEPETELEAGELEPALPDWLNLDDDFEVEPADIPDWLSSEVTVSEVGTVPALADSDIPDWLQSTDTAIDAEDIPDWLRETIDEGQQQVSPPEIAARVEEPAPASSPAPVVPAAATIDAEATLAQARRQISSNNLGGGLIEYESIIRANTALDVVVDDLKKLAEQHNENPAVYRVLGDGYMRQGKLQSALDTYRKALNQL